MNKPNFKTAVSVRKTEILAPKGNRESSDQKVVDPDKLCPLHNKPHSLRKCRGFRAKTLDQRKVILKELAICYKCCSSVNHMAKDCDSSVHCNECKSDQHVTALHPGPAPWKTETPGSEAPNVHGGEQAESPMRANVSKCTEVCGKGISSRSCSKICLVNIYPAGHKEKAVKAYVVLDEQSNRSLAKTEFFEIFNVNTGTKIYTLKTCSGVGETRARQADGFILESLDGNTSVRLPTLIECNMLPDDRSEIPTPEAARHHTHLKHLAAKIPDLDPNASILVLLGRDIPRVHKVREHYNGPHDAPYAQRLDLGWVIIGDVCLGGAHVPSKVSVYRTSVLNNGRTSLLDSCTNSFHVKEKVLSSDGPFNAGNMSSLMDIDGNDCLTNKLFMRTPHDDKPAMSVEDELFLEIMDEQMFMDESNSWVAPLPFKPNRHRLPNNRDQAVQRLNSLRRVLDKKPQMKEHFLNFMEKMFESGHAEPVLPSTKDQECWYLPFFGVYHPRKPDQIRVVFDSNATYKDTSLNNVLLSGPDMNNTLIGVLLRFRKEPVAITADIQQMFYCFVIREDHRDFVRFLWYEGNDPTEAIREYRMTVHVFGNSPSPAIAIYGLRRAALATQDEYSDEAKQFVLKNFYVDDGLASFPSDISAIQTLKSAKEMLADSNIRLHKIASNSTDVMEAFPSEERAKELKNLDLGAEPLPLQRSLGLNWDLQNDCFTFLVSREDKPFTRRGILSAVNSLYDPLGFAAPIIMQGKALIRELCSENCDWDTQLPAEKEAQWKSWKDSLVDLEKLQIPRQYVNTSLQSTCQRELCVFADASTSAISAVAYLRVIDTKGHVHVGFCMGKSKLAPRQVHTVPRLELCASVLAVELANMLLNELDIEIHKVKYYTDSRVVLGYINNSSRRFYVYVANRVARIRKSSEPSQWHLVSTEINSADHGTRHVPASLLSSTNWFTGPDFLRESDGECPVQSNDFQLVEPATDIEVRPQVSTFATTTVANSLGSHRFERFSSWKRLTQAIAKLIEKARSISKATDSNEAKMDALTQAKLVIVRTVQGETFEKELRTLNKGEDILKHSPLKNLNVFLDEEGLVRVGGRVTSAEITQEQSQPIVIPKKHHIAALLVQFYHEQIVHQGRHITEGAIRSAGLWILGGKRLVTNPLNKCTTCRRLRGNVQQQKMADIPADRLFQSPPFTHVGVDVFGPWNICIRRTRGGVVENKRWAVMFTCLVTRGVHIEVVESLSTSSFINALRRFLAIRGPTKLFRSDCGTNFVGACRELQISSEDPELQSYLKKEACTWKFNPPHSSHMGGVWERMIGVARRIFDAMMLKVHSPNLTHEVLVTLMAEVTAIMNGRPLVPVLSDPQQPDLLTPRALLTQKICPVSIPPGDFDPKDLYRKQWKQVQSLANSFWKRWREEYLATLQPRRKWQANQPNLAIGDVVLLKDSQVKRNEWPTGLIVDTYPGRDKRVRKVDVRIVKEGTAKVYSRPVSEIVLLVKG
ncbi:uncharacterized protein LOC130080328 [Rhinichthys klamathensis goyatoka]|uniref:uncharacterized protein LOC130080328 n=1 Tax=Rhinichthys klamathensis goyatoka TaxID=3034132 RepID=UPI0024B4F750|nr:uncharacterized protein LOC130080328 [Rhinichthys klamathensis goyatoka]